MVYHTTVFQFKVPLDMGFAYCKILDFRSIREFDGILAKVYDYLVPVPITNIDILADKDWLFGARRLFSPPPVRGKGAWKRIGMLISNDDNVIPDFKYSNKLSPLVEDESIIKEWDVVHDINEYSEKKYTFNKIKHLESTVVDSSYGIELRTAMEFLRMQGIDPKTKFDLDEMANWNTYREMKNAPVYSTIPKEIRGKAIR
jgi:hypothetical protein